MSSLDEVMRPKGPEAPSSKNVEIYMVRHGKQATYEAVDSLLAPEGEEQAREFAHGLAEHFKDQDVVIKVKGSPIPRATATAKIIQAELERTVKEQGLENIKVLSGAVGGSGAENLRTTGALKPMLEAGVAPDVVVDEWLENFSDHPTAKTPEQVSGQIRDMLTATNKLVGRLPETSSKLVFVWVTHETAHASLAHELTGKKTEEVGGGIKHLEVMHITPNADGNADVEFRGQTYTLEGSKGAG